jgi:hypothetical protein
VVAPWGEDPFVALQHAIDLIGQMSVLGVHRGSGRPMWLRYAVVRGYEGTGLLGLKRFVG